MQAKAKDVPGRARAAAAANEEEMNRGKSEEAKQMAAEKKRFDAYRSYWESLGNACRAWAWSIPRHE